MEGGVAVWSSDKALYQLRYSEETSGNILEQEQKTKAPHMFLTRDWGLHLQWGH